MPRYAKACSVDELKEKLIVREVLDEEGEDLGDDGFYPEGEYGLTQKAWNDLQKVNFDFENSDIGCDMLGLSSFEVLSSGMPVMWCRAGGDWEAPVFFVIYLDDKNALRGYIPKDGNTYNQTTKTAFGSEYEVAEMAFGKSYATREDAINAVCEWISRTRDPRVPMRDLTDDELKACVHEIQGNGPHAGTWRAYECNSFSGDTIQPDFDAMRTDIIRRIQVR